MTRPNTLAGMLLRAIQRLARTLPGPARIAWSLLPRRIQALVRPLVHPVAVGRRGGTQVLEVPWDGTRRGLTLFSGEAEARVVERRFGTDGRRIRASSAPRALEMARSERIVDAVLVEAGEASRTGEEARRLGFRRVDVRDLASDPSALERAFPSVTVVIVAYAGRAILEACLASVFRNTPWPSLEIVVVDNGTTDDTASWLSKTAAAEPSLVVVRNDENLGFAHAANQGIRKGRGDFVVLLNDDTVVAPGWLSRLIAHLESDPRLGLVCPSTNEIGNAAKLETSYRDLPEMEAFALERAFAHAGERDLLPTVALFCAAARRSTLESVGLLDEQYTVGMFEDDDLSLALARRGFGLAVARDAFVHHVGQASFSRLSDAEYLRVWQANRKRFERKWGTSWKPPY